MFKKIKEFFIKLFAFIYHFLFDKDDKEVIKNNKTLKDGKYIIKDSKFVVLPNDGEKGSFTLYPTIFVQEKKSILEKIDNVRKELINSGKDVTKELEEIDKLEKKITNKTTIDVYTEIDTKLDKILSSKDKIEDFNKEITDLLHTNKTSDDDRIIKEAYFKYKTVNYVITTTMKIDEIIEEIKELEEDLKLNKHGKYYYDAKCYDIRNKIKFLKSINEKSSVIKEINRLREDSYTKNNDKYDLLYNEEIFVNLNTSLNNIIVKANEEKKEEKVVVEKKIKLSDKDLELLQKYLKLSKEDIEKLDEEALNKKIKEARKKEEIEIKEEIRKSKEQIEENKKIVKRFKDLKLAEMVLLRSIYSTNYNFNDINDYYNELLRAYEEFNKGETTQFNFDRNRRKTEVAELINRMHYLDARLTGDYFIPIQHINYEYSELVHDAIDWKDRIDKQIYKQSGEDPSKEKVAQDADLKLQDELKKEKERKEKLGVKEKVLVKEEEKK